MNIERTHDVAIVGAGAAGLSGTVALARSLRSVVVVDGGEPRNAPAAGAHNVLGHEGIAPLELLATGRREAEHYGAEIRQDRAIAVRRRGSGFEVDLAGGGSVRARRLLLATGLMDELPDVPGCGSSGDEACCTVPTATGGRYAGNELAFSARAPSASTRL
jgi:thioredoxin reductase